MKARQLLIILIAVSVMGVTAIVAGTYVATTLLGREAKVLRAAKLRSSVASLQQQQLDRAKADIAKYKELATIAAHIVPQDKDETITVREIVNISARSNITKLGAVDFPASNLGSVAGAKPALSQLKPVKDMSGVYTLEIAVKTDNAVPQLYEPFLKYLIGLEKNRRTALVNRITLSPDKNDTSRINFIITLSEYIKP